MFLTVYPGFASQNPIERYREIVLAGRDEMYASYWASHPLSVYENKPPATSGQRDDEKLRAFAMEFGEDVLRITTQQEEELKRRGRYSTEKDIEGELMRLGKIHNELSDIVRGTKTMNVVLESDPETEQQRMNYKHNHLLLPRDVSLGGQPKPTTIVDVEKKRDAAIAMAAEIVGIPIEMTQTKSKQHKANVEGIFSSTNEILKFHISWTNIALTRMFTDIYGETIVHGWDKLHPEKTFASENAQLKYDIEMRSKAKIKVLLYCDPLIAKGDIYDFLARGLITQEEAVRQLTSITGLSPGVLQAVKEPQIPQRSDQSPKKLKNKLF